MDIADDSIDIYFGSSTLDKKKTYGVMVIVLEFIPDS